MRDENNVHSCKVRHLAGVEPADESIFISQISSLDFESSFRSLRLLLVTAARLGHARTYLIGDTMVLPIAHEEESVGFNGEGKNGSEDKLSSIGEVVTTELVAQKVEGTTRLDKIWKGMLDVESRSIQPLDEDERTDAKPRDNFTLWLSMNGKLLCLNGAVSIVYLRPMAQDATRGLP